MLRVSELFYSLQGEGARTGTPTVFIRLQGCSAKFACYASGIRCDTEFESGRDMEPADIIQWITTNAPGCKEVTWTGGEPLDQLTEEIVAYFKGKGFFQAVETSGLRPAPAGIDFICVSPKVAEHVVAKNFPEGVSELRYVRHHGQEVPKPSVRADHYWLSPHCNGQTFDEKNVKHCIDLCKQNPQWKLSLQTHKLLGIL